MVPITKYWPVGSKSMSRRYVSKRDVHWLTKRLVCQFATLAGVVVRSSIAIWRRAEPSAVKKLPIATSFVPSGVMSNLWTRTVPPLCWPANATCRLGSSVPAGRSNAAIRWRVVLLTVENAPPMYSLLFLTSMS